MKRKLFAGASIRALRESRGLTQLELAQRVGISGSYLSQIEANQRPLSGAAVLELARVLRVDVSKFSDADSDRLAAALRETLADPVFESPDIAPRELKDAALNAPRLVRAMIDLHGNYRRLEERYRSFADNLQMDRPSGVPAGQPSPFEEVRDFFHYIGNYVDSLDRAAEDLAIYLRRRPRELLGRLSQHLSDACNIKLVMTSSKDEALFVSALNLDDGSLMINESLPNATKVFAVARHIAHLSYREIIDTVIRQAEFRSAGADAVCRAALMNYWAGALLMPYRAFLDQARSTRHDVERLAGQFGTSMEQVCHRLSTLQRPGTEGVPFYFLRVDRAGNITKRHSATRLQFARYGGACPIWNIHEAFETTDRFLIQVAEMPDGVRYLSLAHAITKGSGRFDVLQRRYAIGFGCELSYASELVYSDAIDLRNPSSIVKIGVSCRLCERPDCPQRAMPPFGRPLSVDPGIWQTVPYNIGVPDKEGSARTGRSSSRRPKRRATRPPRS